ncbi:hypothetical protein [Kitasatospora sp. NPDC057223]|uniref:hypothetical protein n=1 Tax=Kitasatospora sp. NPDC057223 TaxID=3346055 RepID=UPI00363C4147
MTTTEYPGPLPGITARGYRLAGLGTIPLALPRRRRVTCLVNADTGISAWAVTGPTTTSFHVDIDLGLQLALKMRDIRQLESVKSVVRLARWASHLHPRLLDMIANALTAGEPLTDALSGLDDQMRHMLLAAIATDPPEVSSGPWRSEFDRRLERIMSGLALAAYLRKHLVAVADESAESPPEPRGGPDLMPLTMACGIRRRTIPIIPRSLHTGPRKCGATGYRPAA